MKQKQRTAVTVVVLLLLLTLGAVVLAQTSANFNLEWHVVSGGGGQSSSASYRVEGSIGQGIASPPTAVSANFAVSSGYWAGVTDFRVYLPVVVRP